ncbi:hypothetical protein GW17_00054297, partial [Ensete ventricosum]
ARPPADIRGVIRKTYPYECRGRLTRHGTVPFGGGRTCDEGWVWVWGAACRPLLWRGVTPAWPGLLSGGVGLVAT